MMTLQMKFPNGDWADYSHLLIDNSVQITQRLMNERCRSTVDTCQLQMKYNEAMQIALFEANDWIQFALSEGDWGWSWPMGAVAYWPLDEGSGTVAKDILGGNDGTLVGDPTWATGGNALSFYGSDRVTIPSGMPAGDCTFSCAIFLPYAVSGNTERLLVQGPSDRRRIQVATDGRLVFVSRLADGTTATVIASDIVLPRNEWVHVAGVQGGGTLSVYVNAVWSGSATPADIFTSFGVEGSIAADAAGGNGLTGSIAEPRVYDRALTAAEIRSLYEHLRPGKSLFTGVVAPTFGLEKRENVKPIRLEAVDNSYLLDERFKTSFHYPANIGDAAYKLFDADNSSNNVVWKLLDDAGYSLPQDIASGAADINSTVEFFEGTEGDEPYRRYLDDLLSEYGHVLRFDEAGRFTVYQWDKDTVTPTFTIDEDVDIRRRDRRHDGIDVEYAQTAIDDNALLYRERLPISQQNGEWGFTGRPIADTDYYPPDSDIEDIWQRYSIKWLDRPWLERQTRIKNKDISLIAAEASNSTMAFIADDDVDLDASVYESTRAKVRFRNNSGATARIYSMEIRGKALYRQQTRHVVAPSTADRPLEYQSRFLFDQVRGTVTAAAQRYARAMANVLINSTYVYEWRDRTDREIGAIGRVLMSRPSVDQNIVITEKRWNPDRTTYHYTAVGISEYSAYTVSNVAEGDGTVTTPDQQAKNIAETGLMGEDTAVGSGASDDPAAGHVIIYQGRRDDDETNGFRIKEWNGESYEPKLIGAMRTGGGVADLFVSGFLEAGESVLSSPGLIWRNVPNDFGSFPPRIVHYGNGVWLTHRGFTSIARSTDNGETWSAGGPATGGGLYWNMRYANGTWIMVGNSASIAISTDDGESWTVSKSNPFDDGVMQRSIRGIDVVGTTWIIVGESGIICRSTDNGANWTNIDNPFDADYGMWTVSGNGDEWIAAGDNGRIIRSTDGGLTWGTAVISNPFGTSRIRSVEHGGGSAVACGDDGTLAVSKDGGATWGSLIDAGFGTEIVFEVAYGGGVWVAVGNDAIISRSTDGGATWGSQTYGAESISAPADYSQLGAVHYSSETGRWIAVGTLGIGDAGVLVSDWLEAGSGIVEQGENANGQYVRFSSGLQICTHRFVVGNCNFAWGALFRTDNWGSAKAYPKPFTAVHSVSGSAGRPTEGTTYWVSLGRTGSLTHWPEGVAVRVDSRTDADLEVMLTAIGRWK